MNSSLKKFEWVKKYNCKIEDSFNKTNIHAIKPKNNF